MILSSAIDVLILLVGWDIEKLKSNISDMVRYTRVSYFY